MDISKSPFLEIKGIKKKYGSVEALKGVDLSIYQGEVLAIVGDNGAGKSTMIKVLSGAMPPDSGEILVRGKKYDKLRPKTALAAGISTVYQDLALVNTLDIADNIFLGREKRFCGCWLDRRSMRADAAQLLKDLNIQIPFYDAFAGELSGGQRQAVAVARAVHQGGQLLIFDEPTAAMGLKETQCVVALIKSLAEKGLGVVIISHNMEQVFQLADRICIMRHGEIVGCVKKTAVTPGDVVAMITGAKRAVSA